MFEKISSKKGICQAICFALGLLWGAPGWGDSGSGAALKERLAGHVDALAGMGSRVSGYAGAGAAADYLEEQLRGFGIEEIYRREFDLPVPFDEGAGLTLLDGEESFPLHCMWPNLVRTPTLPREGIEGMLVYGGRGAAGDLDGLEIEGNIILLEYNCGMNWVTSFDLGAAAVIFMAPERTHRKEGADKFLATPADLPRFYAPAETSRALRRRLAKGEMVARLRGRMSWQLATAENLVCVIPGADPQLGDQALLVGAYYDAISPVPALAPGAEQGSGAAVWLEILRELSAKRPQRTVIGLATAGHFQALAGMRDLVALLRRSAAADSTLDALGERLRDFEVAYYLGLDLSSRGRRLCLVQAGFPYRVRTIEPPVYERIVRFAEEYEERELGGRMILGGELKPRRQRRLTGQLPERVPVEGAVVELAGYLGLTLVTAGDERAAFDSPLDLPEEVEIDNVAHQARFLNGLFRRLVDDPEMGVQISERSDGFGTLRGQVLSWGTRSYGPDQPVQGAWVRVRSLHKNAMGVRMEPLARTDAQGRFEIAGLEARTLYLKPLQLEVYGLDRETGAVTLALDRGPNGAQQFPAEVLMGHLEEEVTLVGFDCRAMTLFDLFDPRYLFTLERIRLLDAGQEADLPSYGHCLPFTFREIEQWGYQNTAGGGVERVAVALVPDGAVVKATMTTGAYGLGRRLLLLNGSPEAPEGKGIAVGKQTRLTRSGLRIARDTFLLNGARLGKLERHGIRSGLLSRLHGRTDSLLQAAKKALKNRQHGRLLDLSRRAWGLASRTYGDIQGLTMDVVRGVIFFLIVLLPFAYFGERLLFDSTKVRRQVGGTALVFLVAFLALRYVHPAFELSIYPALILLGFLILALSLVVSILGLSRLNAQLHESLSARIALHRADTSRSGVLIQALLLGVAQMRRRPWRTGLTCTTLALLTFSLLSFTSVRSTLRVNRTKIGTGAARDGLLVRLPGWQGMEENAYDHLRQRFGKERTLPRAWYLQQGLLEGKEKGETRVDAVLGLSAGEKKLGLVETALIAGRFFAPEEEQVCILADGLAEGLGIEEEEVGLAWVRFLGGDYRVVGLMDSRAFDRLKDINGMPLAPLDREVQQPEEERTGRGRRGMEPAFAHMSSARLLLLPYEAVRRWGEWSRLASVAVAFEEGEDALEEIEAFAEVVGLNLFAAVDGRRYLINAVGVQSFSGQRDLLVPVLIAALIAFNTMLGAVHERLSEIGTLNAIGLAPLHVAGLFLAEAGVYANLSGVLGYLLGQLMAKIGWIYGLFPGLTVNYSSLSAVGTIGALMLVVLLSSAYPAWKASRICVPGIERRWRLPEPEGALLQVEMPFTLVGEEAGGLVAFIGEYLDAYNEQSIGAGFYAEELRCERGEGGVALRARLWLAPFDQGISEELAIEVRPEEETRFCGIHLRIERLSGDASAWKRGNRILLNDIRKQFLVWRSLGAKQRQLYLEERAV